MAFGRRLVAGAAAAAAFLLGPSMASGSSQKKEKKRKEKEHNKFSSFFQYFNQRRSYRVVTGFPINFHRFFFSRTATTRNLPDCTEFFLLVLPGLMLISLPATVKDVRQALSSFISLWLLHVYRVYLNVVVYFYRVAGVRCFPFACRNSRHVPSLSPFFFGRRKSTFSRFNERAWQ